MRSPGSGPLWLVKLEKNMPEAIRKLELGVLMYLTAVSCGRKAPSMHGMDSKECLKCYRGFTVDAVEACNEEALLSFRENMYRRAFRTGRGLSLLPGLREWENRKRLIVLLYRNIGIELTNGEGGDSKRGVWNICIPRCSFSAAYTPKVCHVMSGMDAGIICGILGGGKLDFVQRITEGYPCCSAVYQKLTGRKGKDA